jgi:hypothetical protein
MLTFSSLFAQTPTRLNEVHFIGDIDQSINGTSGVLHNTNDTVINFNINSGSASTNNDLGILDNAGIDAYHKTGDGCGDTMYSLDTSAVIASTAMRPSDVFTATGTKVLDGKAAGIPDGVNIDAISRDPTNCNLLFSIDHNAIIKTVAYKNSDIIAFSGSSYSLYQSTGLNVNIDALHVLSSSRMLVSVDVGQTLPDINVFDEDILEINTSSSPFQLLIFEPSMFNNSWQAADVKALWALPKPTADFMFADGFE